MQPPDVPCSSPVPTHGLNLLVLAAFIYIVCRSWNDQQTEALIRALEKTQKCEKETEEEGWGDASDPRGSVSHPCRGLVQALRALVGMKDEQETTAPPGDGWSTRVRM